MSDSKYFMTFEEFTNEVELSDRTMGVDLGRILAKKDRMEKFWELFSKKIEDHYGQRVEKPNSDTAAINEHLKKVAVKPVKNNDWEVISTQALLNLFNAIMIEIGGDQVNAPDDLPVLKFGEIIDDVITEMVEDGKFPEDRGQV